MNRLRAWIRNLLGFSRTETNGFLILLPLIVLILASEPLYRWWVTSRDIDRTSDTKMLDSLIAQLKWSPRDSIVIKKPLFRFNPNLASHEDLIRLGLEENLVKRIENYRLKGGRFKIKADLSKMYGLDSMLFLSLYPFIDLPEQHASEKTVGKTFSSYENKNIADRLDINLADTTQLIKIYGVGTKLSQRIIRYRDGLGGFVSLTQLNEVYGLDSMVVKRLTERFYVADSFSPRKININTMDEGGMATHPYLKRSLARAITAYRFQHGRFAHVDDLRSIESMDELTFQKIKPYLTLKD